MHDPLIRRLASNGKVKSAATRGPGFSWPRSAPPAGVFSGFQYPTPPLQVSLKRKRGAVNTLAAQAVDKSGRAAPFSSGLAYQRSSVAVPFGGCTEPSNVKAGGNACPIRFQCAGCGFYRPDPSYLAAIEQHVNDLRADHETAQAMDAADFVMAGLTGQIDSYTSIAATMRQRLTALPDDQRAEIEEASAIMRKTRVGGRTMLPLLPEPGAAG
jgi:hypothetical protein